LSAKALSYVVDPPGGPQSSHWLQARAGSDDQEWLGFLMARGFAETMRMHRQELDVAAADLSPREDIMTRLAGQGIVLVPLEHELARGQACWAEFACRVEPGEDGSARRGGYAGDRVRLPCLQRPVFATRRHRAGRRSGCRGGSPR
jgi:hypothetical protein